MDLSKIHEDFSEKLRIKNTNGYVLGQISDFQDDPGRLEMQTRILKVSRFASVMEGQVVVDAGGNQYLLANHMASHSAGIIYNTFRMIPVDEELAWSRQTSAIDPISGISRGETTSNLGTITCTVEPINLEKRAKMKPESKVLIITGEAVEIADRVGDYTVTFVDRVLGISVAEAQ